MFPDFRFATVRGISVAALLGCSGKKIQANALNQLMHVSGARRDVMAGGDATHGGGPDGGNQQHPVAGEFQVGSELLARSVAADSQASLSVEWETSTNTNSIRSSTNTNTNSTSSSINSSGLITNPTSSGSPTILSLISSVQFRGKEIIDATGKSSAPSAALACVDQMKDWVMGRAGDSSHSMAVITHSTRSEAAGGGDRSAKSAVGLRGGVVDAAVGTGTSAYGIPSGLCFSFPVKTFSGRWAVVGGLEIGTQFEQEIIQKNVQELLKERDAVRSLFGGF
jgi:hypothetical protein